MTCPGRQLGINGVRRAKEHPEDMAAQRAARRFMVMPAGNAAHMEARVALGGKPCYAVGPVGGAVARLEVQAGARRPTLGRTIGLVHGLH